MKNTLAYLLLVIVMVILGFLVMQWLDRPVAYYSYSAYVSGVEKCVFVDTAEGQKPCTAFSEEKLQNMERAWAD